MKLIRNGSSLVVAEDKIYSVGQRVRVPIAGSAEASGLFNDALPDQVIVTEWEVVAVDMTRNVAYAEPLGATAGGVS